MDTKVDVVKTAPQVETSAESYSMNELISFGSFHV